MPYPGIEMGSPAEAKMERCVIDLVSQGKSKEQAIAICHAAIAGEADVAVVRAGLDLSEASEQDLVGLTAEEKQGRVLKFDNAVLAHVTVNKNGDGLTSDGLKQIAATLPGMPLNIGHDGKRIMGVFLSATTRAWNSIPDGELVGSGLIFAMHFPDEVKEIQAGERKLSIEATAERAVFHVDALTGQRTRYLFGLTALGAATTKNPADANAVFDTAGGLLMISEVKETIYAERKATDLHYMVRDAFKRHFRDEHTVVEIAAKHIIFERQGKYYRTDYALDASGNVAFGDKHTELLKQWVPTGGSLRSQEGDSMEELQEQLNALQAELEAVKATLEATAAQVAAKDAEIERLTAEVNTLTAQAEAQATEFKASLTRGVKRAVEMAPVLDEMTDAVIEELTAMGDSAYGLMLKASAKSAAATRGIVPLDDKPQGAKTSGYDYKTIFAVEED